MPVDPVALLVAEVKVEVERARMLAAESAGIADDGSTPARRALGSILHDFYNCCERIFPKIAIEVNGGFDDSPPWHRSLLQRMATPLPGLRPAVLSPELAADLEEYLSFRHVFRSIYGFELKGERVGRLARMLPALAERFANEILAFLGTIEAERR